MYYESVLRTFHREKVRYLIAGGMAVNLYGVPRFTKDLDILIDPSEGNLRRLEKALRFLGYRPKVPVSMKAFLKPENWKKWKKEKGMLALNLYHPAKPYEEIDLLVNLPIEFSKAKKNSKIISAGNLRLHLVGLEDLIRLKRQAKREQDLADIEALQKVRKVKANK